MQLKSRASVLGFALALASPLALAETLPALPGTGDQSTSQATSVGTAAKDALNSVKSARSNIAIKDYISAKTDISSAESNLKILQSSPEMGKLEGMMGRKKSSSALSKAQSQLGEAKGALAQNDPKKADSLLKRAEGLLTSIV